VANLIKSKKSNEFDDLVAEKVTLWEEILPNISELMKLMHVYGN
jgi:hypothetical protein